MFHLTQRVAWHDNKWDCTVCKNPSLNSFCIALDRIRAKRDDPEEVALAGQSWNVIPPDELPPCIAESGGFMNNIEWVRIFKHPYLEIAKTKDTHGHLKPKTIKIPPYSTIAVPFSWMLVENQDKIDDSLPTPLPPEVAAPFHSAWVFGHERQEALLKLVFSRLTPKESLIFFYTKEGQPLGDHISRLVVGVGRILNLGKLEWYDTDKKQSYPLWDRIVQHSIRLDDTDGFLFPYHEYLRLTGDQEEDIRRLKLLQEVAVIPESIHTRDFSYASELATADVALSTLVRCLESVRKIRAHGIAEGPWDKREEWLNHQIAQAWKDRGAFPGIGPALEALGMRLGTSLSLDLISSGLISTEDNPWPVVDKIVKGIQEPPNPAYKADLGSVRKTWTDLPDGRRDLLNILSRFNLSSGQAVRWFNAKGNRDSATRSSVTDADILANPYLVSELDLGDAKEPPVSIGVIDRGMLPEDTIKARHPLPENCEIESTGDPRRIRAALVSVLRNAAVDGDSLLSIKEVMQRVEQLDLAAACPATSDWIYSNKDTLGGVIELLEIQSNEPGGKNTTSLQLTEIKEREKYLARILKTRAGREVDSLSADWATLLKAAITEAKSSFDEKNPRHISALNEQADALEIITTRKLSVLVGKAGTGKTSVLGALLKCGKLNEDGILLLAPTGKARVRLGKATNQMAMTIAQFLFSLKRYDGARQRPLFKGETYRKEKTVVIDECSMLTLDDLCAVFKAMDLAHVTRIILVGDPNQLPPIGVGRPFADFVGHLDKLSEIKEPEHKHLSQALARLSVEVRAQAGSPSDTLRLASWFTREPQPVDADRVISDLELGKVFNDLEICFWKTPEDLHRKILEMFKKYLGLLNEKDTLGFNRALGIDADGRVPFDSPDGVENFQILSPMRMHPHGIYDLNRWVQTYFRHNELENGRQLWGTKLGDEEIVVRDKVIQVRNQWRDGFNQTQKQPIKDYLANGEIGLVATSKSGFLNIAFAGRPHNTFGYRGRDFPGGSGPIELAYALTIHKAQGSEFQKVFVILPKQCSIVSRELLYTALTRSKERLILLIEGDDVSVLYDLTRPECSETARRNSNLFESEGAVREDKDRIPYADHLIHRTLKGHMVRSKSELAIANMLFQMGEGLEDYHYERPLDGTKEPGRLRPDFTFIDAGGDPIIWEHLGMLSRGDYKRAWEWKEAWYFTNGFTIGSTLFTTEDEENGGLDSEKIRKTALAIKDLL
jgi:ATP-dependent exoDNAse (exonuclease V) alpha subunit